MPAQSIVFAALALFLPVLAAQTAQPAPTRAAAAAAEPDLSGQGAVVEKIASTIRFAKDGSSVRTLAVMEQGTRLHVEGELIVLKNSEQVVRRVRVAEIREVLDLIYYHEKDEVAEIVGIPVGTVKTRMFYARNHMKASLRRGGVNAP